MGASGEGIIGTTPSRASRRRSAAAPLAHLWDWQTGTSGVGGPRTGPAAARRTTPLGVLLWSRPGGDVADLPDQRDHDISKSAPSGESGIRTRGPPFGRHSISNAAQSATLPSLRTPKRASGTACGRIWQSGGQFSCPVGSGPAMSPGRKAAAQVSTTHLAGARGDHRVYSPPHLPADILTRPETTNAWNCLAVCHDLPVPAGAGV